MDLAIWIVLGVFAGTLVVVAALAWRPARTAWREKNLIRARRDFHLHREHLEARFIKLAGSSGKPRGLDWVRCEFDDSVIYARDRQSGELSAFVAIVIGFEAIEGGGMESVEAVGNLRAGTAVFRLHQGNWSTDGRAIFNLNPTEAVRYFKKSLEMVGQEPC
ncbi:MAG TPA: hypothetical protein VMF30_17465 [Pirellulales bacterium]|nr:hypothetical protein [Pirellulales bacterium]